MNTNCISMGQPRRRGRPKKRNRVAVILSDESDHDDSNFEEESLTPSDEELFDNGSEGDVASCGEDMSHEGGNSPPAGTVGAVIDGLEACPDNFKRPQGDSAVEKEVQHASLENTLQSSTESTQTEMPGTRQKRSKLKMQRSNGRKAASLSSEAGSSQNSNSSQESLGAHSAEAVHKRSNNLSPPASSATPLEVPSPVNLGSGDTSNENKTSAVNQTPKKKKGRVAQPPNPKSQESCSSSSSKPLPQCTQSSSTKPPPQCRVETSSSNITNNRSEPNKTETKRSFLGSGPDSATGETAKTKKKRTFQDMVLHNMLLACKPFSLKTLAQANRSTPEAMHNLMLSLVDKELVLKKEFPPAKPSGRTKELYWANQESTSKETKNAMATPEEIKLAQDELGHLIKQESSAQREMSALMQEPTNEELDAQVRTMEEEVKGLLRRAEETKKRVQAEQENAVSSSLSGTKLKHERCPRRTRMRINAMRDHWKQRKEKCMDFVGQLADAMEKKDAHVLKLLDVDTDEMENVKMPPKYTIDPK